MRKRKHASQAWQKYEKKGKHASQAWQKAKKNSKKAPTHTHLTKGGKETRRSTHPPNKLQ
jgi:hypothetical protein